MAKISSHVETVVLGSRRRYSYSPETTTVAGDSDDINFNDVFGGPPSRFSIQEALGSNFTGELDKPVFGDETANRRRHQSYDFYDDIFGGDENCKSPRRVDLDPFCSTPGSRVLSPAPPLPPKVDHFPSSPFSLPPKSTKTTDFPLFASSNCNPYKYKDNISNGTDQSYIKSASLSRFSSQAIHGQYESKNDVQSWYCQSPVSHESSPSSENSSNMTKSDETETGCNLKTNSKSTDSLSSCSSSRFHFSIYKWAGRGISLPMTLRGRNSTNSQEKWKFHRCPSSNGRIESDRYGSLHGIETIFPNNSILSDTEYFNMEGEMQVKTSNQNGVKPFKIFEEAVHDTRESKYHGVQCDVDNVPFGTIFTNEREETKLQSLPVKNGREVSKVIQEARKSKLKRNSLFPYEIEEQGEKEITQKDEGKEKTEKIVKMFHPTADATKPIKKNDGRKMSSNKTEVDKSTLITSADNLRRSGANVKVMEFVKIFNQEASPEPKINATRTPSARWKGSCPNGVYSETKVGTNGMEKKSHLPDVNKMPDASSRVDESPQQSEEKHDHIKATIASDYHFSQKDASLFSESLPDDSKVTIGKIDDHFLEDFLIKELANDEDNLQQSGLHEDVQVWDAKIQQWSNGKQGNIRSLLSTLHHILWPQSGWKPVPLVDIIEGSAVKRAYQKALLRLHPDKLQQKGAPSHQKYIAEKVFDILQEAWDHFNTLGAL